MFGLSIEHLFILLAAALFILGPERLPGAAEWLGRTLRTARSHATAARDQITNELGPEFEELRKPLAELNAVRGMNPRTAVTRYLLDDTAGKPPVTSTPVPSDAGLPTPGAGTAAKVDMEAT